MAKYSKQQWITAEETYKNTGSYLRATEKSGIPVSNIKVKSVRRSWKREKDSNVYRMYTEISSIIQQEVKKEVKTVLEKSREIQKLINNELKLCENTHQKATLMNVYIKTLWLEGRIAGEFSNGINYSKKVVGKPILGNVLNIKS